MKYFKNSNGKLFIDPIKTNHNDLVAITKEEFDQLLQQLNTPTEEEEIKAHNSKVSAQIADLEAKQNRPLREVSLDPTNQDAKDRILLIDSEIEALRATFK